MDRIWLNSIEDLKDYDYFEKFDPDKEYEIEKFDFDYGKGEELYELRKSKIDNEWFVIACRRYHEDELKKLQKFCPCSHCNNYFRKIPCIGYIISELFYCKECFQCIKTGPEFVRYSHVDKARIRYKKII